MKQLGRVGKIKAKKKRLAKMTYVRAHGEKLEETWRAPCQSCTRTIWFYQADPSHKHPAGRVWNYHGPDIDGPENIQYVCRICHDFSEIGEWAIRARDWILKDPANVLNGLRIDWPRDIWAALILHHKRVRY
ncbi:MAG: hypothetical protein IID28_11500 [Planctomycetes bacterium]|nr:hypothetical protein [Planctomycetota bacterium]